MLILHRFSVKSLPGAVSRVTAASWGWQPMGAHQRMASELSSLEWGRPWYDDLTQFFEAAARADNATLV
jgi:hypothetical protein